MKYSFSGSGRSAPCSLRTRNAPFHELPRSPEKSFDLSTDFGADCQNHVSRFEPNTASAHAGQKKGRAAPLAHPIIPLLPGYPAYPYKVPIQAPAPSASKIVATYNTRSQFRSSKRLSPRYPLCIACIVCSPRITASLIHENCGCNLAKKGKSEAVYPLRWHAY